MNYETSEAGAFPEVLERGHREECRRVPSKKAAVEFLGDVVALLFPITHGEEFSRAEIERRWEDVQEQLRRLVAPVLEEGEGESEARARGEVRAREVAEKFFGQVPAIYESLLDDAAMYNDCDPASSCREEVVLCYPGFYAVMVHRLAHALYRLGVPIVPRILSEHAHSRTGIEIHPGAEIGRNFYIDHGTGIVIGETCVIGQGVKMYQGVTLGATFVKRELRGTKRHPTIEDDVILYAGCTILGGDTVIGRGSVIGGNVWLLESVPAGTKVFHRPDIVTG